MAMAGGGEGKAGKGAGLFGLVVKICFGLGLVAVAVLFVAAIDFGVMDLRHALAMPALAALVVLVLCGSIGGFASMKNGGGLEAQVLGDAAAVRDEVMARMAAVESKFSGYLGEEADRIKKENGEMRAELDKIKQDEEDRLRLEFEELKQRNLELQVQLRAASMAQAEAPAGQGAGGAATGQAQGEAA